MYKKTFGLSFLFLSFLSINFCVAQSGYTLQKKISLPGNGSWDYLKIDNDNRLFVSHGDRVHVINLKTCKEINEIKNLHSAKHIVLLKQFNKGFISNADNNTVLVFNYTTMDSIANINVHGESPDPMCYDEFSEKLYVFCDNNIASIIDPLNNKEISTINLKGAPEFPLPDNKGIIYNNLEDKDAVEVIDLEKKQVTKIYNLKKNAAPTGMAADLKNNRLFVACRGINELAILDSKSGKIIASLPISEKVDGVYFDEKNKYIFCSGGDGFVTIIVQKSKDDYAVLQKLKTRIGAKTMALDNGTHNLYLSTADFEKGRIKPNSFALYIYSQKALF